MEDTYDVVKSLDKLSFENVYDIYSKIFSEDSHETDDTDTYSSEKSFTVDLDFKKYSE